MSRSFSWGKVGIVVLVVLVLVGGAAGYLYFFWNVNERALLSGERAYKTAEAQLASDPAKAEAGFDAAVLQADKVMDAVDKEFGGGTVKSEKQAQRLGFLAARALWLKATALRDRAYAKAAAESKPIAPTTDTTQGVTFRSVLSIPDSKDRNEALRCLREAAARLPGEAAIQTEALRAETMMSPVNWRLVELFAKQLLKEKEDDTRALYQLGIMHYEQAPIDTKGRQGPPPPLEKRSAARMKEARDYLEKAKKTKDAKYWRQAVLDANITRWLRSSHAAAGRTDQRLKEDARLRKLLEEARQKAEEPKALESLAVFDVRGLLELHLLALDEAAAKALKEEGAAKDTVQMLDRLLAVCEKAARKDAPRGVLEESARTAARGLATARPSSREEAAAWDARIARATALAERARDANAVRPEMYAGVARLLALEASLAGKKGETARQKKHDEAATKWLEDGLARGQKAGLSPEALGDLHIMAAERKMLRGESLEKVKSHLDVLRKAGTNEARALALFLEAAGLERQGRLATAARKLEEAEALGQASTRTDAALSSLYLALGKPQQALTRLVRLRGAYKQLDSLSEQERAWVEQFMRGKEDVQLQIVVASLDSALRAIAEWRSEKPGQPVPADRWQGLEKQARDASAQLPESSPQARAAALALLRFQQALGRREEAAKELAAFEKAYPGDTVGLMQRVALAMVPEPGTKPPATLPDKKRDEVDGLIQAHLKSHPGDTGAKLFWASWLSRTGRADKALAYLKSPSEFPDTNDRYRQVLALALIASGDRAGGTEVLRQLPATAAIDAALVRLAGSGSERDKKLAEALQRHERDGLLRCMAGASAMEKGRFAEAGEEFFRALEFTQTRRMAEQGLQQALVAHARAKPAEAREQAARMIREAPQEKAPYLGYAFAALMLDDIGQPFQAWETARNMSSALRVWEGMLRRDTGERFTGLLTRAEFWRLAGRTDLALAETERALKDQPGSVQALALAAELALQDPVAGDPAKQIDALAATDPANASVPILRIRLMLQEKKFADAAKALAAYLEKNPDREEARLLLVEALLRQKDNAAAEAAVKAWRSKNPASLVAAALQVQARAAAGQADEAKALAGKAAGELLAKAAEERAKAKPPAGVKPEAWKQIQAKEQERLALDLKTDLARPLMRAGAWTQADSMLKEILDKDPAHPGALLLSGESALNKQDWKTARAFYQRLLKAVPGNVVAANNLAWLMADKTGETDKAREILEPLLKGQHSGKPISGDRLLPDLLDTAAVVYRKAGDPAGLERLKKLLIEARARYPRDPRLALHLGHAYAGLEDAARARDLFDTAIRLASEDAQRLEPAVRQALVKEAEEARKKL